MQSDGHNRSTDAGNDPAGMMPATRPWRSARAVEDGVLAQFRQLIGLLGAARARRSLVLFALGLVAVILLNAVAQVRLNAWQGNIYDAIGSRDLSVFYHQLGVFAAIASALLVLGVSQTWLHEMLKVKLREAVSADLVTEWLRPKRAYRLPLAGEIGSHPDQRIQDDSHRLTELTADLGVGLVQSSLLLVSFVGVLWVLSAQVVFVVDGDRFTIPGYMVWCALAYALIGSFFVWLVGRPLIRSNGALRAAEAEFRFMLVRVDENAEAIAIHRGEADEQGHLGSTLATVIDMMRRIATQLVNLTWVTAIYGWLGLIAPIVLAAPGYFSGTLSLGGLMMVVGAFYQVQQALRWYIDRFPTLAEWNAALSRVMSYRDVLLHPDGRGAGRRTITYAERSDGKLSIEDICVSGPQGTISLSEPHLEIAPGERVLIAGSPQSGKTTFFRALAGLWIWGSGTIRLPAGSVVMYLPRQPYLPLGTLREVLTYPSTPEGFSDETLTAILKRFHLDRLLPALDKSDRWDQELSLDEQQRIAVGRALLHKPDWIIHDEGMSELDEDARKLCNSLFHRELAATGLITVGEHGENGGLYGRVLHLRAVPFSAEPVSAVRGLAQEQND